MLKAMELLPGIRLRTFQDTRFKQGCLSLQLVRPMDREEAAMNALLSAVLLRGCTPYPDLQAITLHLDALYGASIGTLVRRVGDYQATGFYCSFIEDRFAMGEDAVLAPMVDFLGSLLLDPVLEDGLLRWDFIEGEKKNLMATIDSQLNDKRVYASSQLMKHMCSADSFGIPRLGRREDVAAIDAASLTAHYRKILSESPIELFYVGSQDMQTVADLLKPLFASLDRRYTPLPAQTPFRTGGGGDFSEEMDVTQGKLAMGFVTPITLRDPRFAAMQVCNTVFGAGQTCKLFMNIRERNSLCYDVGSGYHGSKGIIAVSAGIDFDKEVLVRRQVLQQLDACREGQISPQELSAAKASLLSSLRGTHDAPGSIEGYYATAALSGMSMTPERYMQAVEAVTAQDVAAAARTVTLDTVYFLRGAR